MVVSLSQEKSSFTYEDYGVFSDGARCEIGERDREFPRTTPEPSLTPRPQAAGELLKNFARRRLPQAGT